MWQASERSWAFIAHHLARMYDFPLIRYNEESFINIMNQHNERWDVRKVKLLWNELWTENRRVNI